MHLAEIEELWLPTLREWIEPDHIPDFDETVAAVALRLRELRLT